MDWTAILLIIAGLITTGLGSFKLLKKKNASPPPAPATKAPVIHTPSEEAVKQLDQKIESTQNKLKEVRQKQETIESTTPSKSKPNSEVAAWLNKKRKQ